MRLNNITFPHPVLGIGNSVIGPIALDHSIVQTDDTYDCAFKCQFDDDFIKELVADKKAAFFCEATCSGTLYRKSVTEFTPELTMQIERKDVRSTVDILVAIIALEEIPEYRNGNVSPLYKGFDSFFVQKGDLLAAFGEIRIEADIQYEKLKAVSQIFVVVGGYERNTVYIDLTGEKIVVRMPDSMYVVFARESINKNSLYAPLFHASIVLNALIKALQEIDSYKDKLWAKTILHRLETEPEPKFKSWRDRENVEEIAQLLLNNPYDSMLRAISIIDTNSKN